MRSSHAVIIYNPRAGRGRGERLLPKIRAALEAEALKAKAEGIDAGFEIVATERAGLSLRTGEMLSGSASSLARQAVLKGASVVVAAGGDGTIGEVANGLAGSPCPLAVIPIGTGNDLARHIGLWGRGDLAIQTVFRGQPRKVDLARIGRGLFINAASFGFDAEVTRKANSRMSVLVGSAAYVIAALESMAHLKPVEMEVTIDGIKKSESALLCAVANTRSYGGGMAVAPQARMDDGLLDVVLVREAGALEFLMTLPKVFWGGHLSHPKVAFWRGTRIQIQSHPAAPSQADGEMLGGTPAVCEVIPKGLILLHPRDVLP